MPRRDKRTFWLMATWPASAAHCKESQAFFCLGHQYCSYKADNGSSLGRIAYWGWQASKNSSDLLVIGLGWGHASAVSSGEGGEKYCRASCGRRRRAITAPAACTLSAKRRIVSAIWDSFRALLRQPQICNTDLAGCLEVYTRVASSFGIEPATYPFVNRQENVAADLP